MSYNTLLLESDLPPETEYQISNIMNWRLPRDDIDSESEEEDPFPEFPDKLLEGKKLSVAFEDEVKPTSKRKPRKLKGRRSVRPISEREGDISPKQQMKMGKSYASFFHRIDNMDTSDEDELNIRLTDGLRTWLKFGMNVTGNTDVINFWESNHKFIKA